MLDAVCNWAKYNILSKRRSSIRWRVFRYLSSTSQRENVKNLFFWNFALQLQPHNSQRIEIDPKQKLRANVCMPCLLTTYEIFGKYLRKVFKYLRSRYTTLSSLTITLTLLQIHYHVYFCKQDLKLGVWT